MNQKPLGLKNRGKGKECPGPVEWCLIQTVADFAESHLLPDFLFEGRHTSFAGVECGRRAVCCYPSATVEKSWGGKPGSEPTGESHWARGKPSKKGLA